MNKKPIFLIFLFALGLRLAYFIYNLNLDIPHVWFETTLFSLRIAEHIMGVVPSLDFDLERAKLCYNFDFRGVAFIHMALIWLFGKSSLNAVVLIQILLDACAVFFIGSIAHRLSGERLAKWAAIAYAMFPVAIYMTGTATWHTWINVGMIILSWALIEMWHCTTEPEPFQKRRYWFYASILLLTILILPHFRVTILFFVSFFSVWSLLPCLKMQRTKDKALPLLMYFATCHFVTLVSILFFYGINVAITGSTAFGRTSYAHSFFMGVGERPNPYAGKHRLDGSDASIIHFYMRETGDQGQFDALSTPRYKEWTRAKMIEFIKENKALYASLICKRIIEMFAPNFRISLVSDTEAMTSAEPESSRQERLSIIRSPGRFSWSSQKRLFQINKIYFFEFWIRIFTMTFLPVGFLLGLLCASGPQKWRFYLLLAPLVYFCVMLAWIRLPNFDHAAAWSVALSASVMGWQRLYDRIKARVGSA